MDYTQYKGIVHGMPEFADQQLPKEKFFLSLAFFLPKTDMALSAASLLKTPKNKLGDAYWNGLERSDPELSQILKAIDSKKALLSVYWGEPNEDLEFFLEDLDDDLRENDLQSFGYLLIHTTGEIEGLDSADSDHYEPGEKVWDALVIPSIKSLFQHLEQKYLAVET